MCLEIVAVVAPSAEKSVSTAALSEATGLKVRAMTFEGKNALHLSRNGGCSCDFLGDEAEFEAAHWILDAQGLPTLVKAVKHLSGVARRFSLIAHWLGGDLERRSERLGAAALAKLLQANKLGNNVVYHVGHNG